jgi:alkyldihydroxyacetonephosphate synthase
MDVNSGLIEDLRAVTTVVDDVSGYDTDWWVYPKLPGVKLGGPLAVVKPTSVDQVAKILKICGERAVGVTCRGGGSSVTGASIPIGTVAVDMSGLNRIVRLDGDNMTVDVEPGVKLSHLESQLNSLGYTLGQFPQSFELATVGGFLSTMGTGEFSGRYGGAEDSCVGLRVLLPDGSLVDTRPTDAPRTSAGPDATRLFVGAEGTLGIIVGARLRIHRLPKHLLKLAFRFDNFVDAVSRVKPLLDLDVAPWVCRVYNESESSFVFGENRPTLLVIYGFNSPRVMDDLKEEVTGLLVAGGADPAQPHLVDTWLNQRFSFMDQLKMLGRAGYIAETVDLGVSWTMFRDLYLDVSSSASGLGGVVGLGAHVSHIYPQGLCLYLTVIMKPDAELYRALWRRISDSCRTRGATVTHHHGVGALKSGMVKHETPYVLLQKIKAALDPHNMMNPGKLFG